MEGIKTEYNISEIIKCPIYYLPGVIVNTLDGGLSAAFDPEDDSILVIGTAGKGIVNTPYQVTDRALAAQQFGFAGSLERGIEECASNPPTFCLPLRNQTDGSQKCGS